MKVDDGEQTMWSTWEPQSIEEIIARHKQGNAILKEAMEGEMVLYLNSGGRFRRCWSQSGAPLHQRVDVVVCKGGVTPVAIVGHCRRIWGWSVYSQ